MNLRRQVEQIKKAVDQMGSPAARLEYWTASEYAYFQQTGERPGRDTSEPCDPPLVMLWGDRVLIYSQMDMREL